jgi:capsular polysaccharide biosynthesis protein
VKGMEELDLKQLFKIFWNKRLHIIAIVLVFLIIGAIYTFTFVKPKYQAYTTLVLAQSDVMVPESDNQQGITQSELTLNQKLVPTYSELVKTKNVLREVIRELRLNIDEEDLRKNVSVKLVEDTELIKITVTNKDPADAKDIANKIAEIFSDRVSEIYKINNVTIVDEAEEATEPCNINHLKDLAIFMVIGLVVAVVYVLLTNLLDTTVKSAEDIEKELDVSVLVSIPTIKDDSKLNKGGIY